MSLVLFLRHTASATSVTALYFTFFCSPDLVVSVTVVKQEDVFTRDNTRFVRVTVNVMTSGNVVDFRTLRDIDMEALETKISGDDQFGGRIKVGCFDRV